MPPSNSTTPPEENFTDLEAHLAGTLKRVAPPREISQRLRVRIHMPEPRLIAQRIASWRFFFVVLGGVMSGTMLVITVARAMYHLFWRKT